MPQGFIIQSQDQINECIYGKTKKCGKKISFSEDTIKKQLLLARGSREGSKEGEAYGLGLET